MRLVFVLQWPKMNCVTSHEALAHQGRTVQSQADSVSINGHTRTTMEVELSWVENLTTFLPQSQKEKRPKKSRLFMIFSSIFFPLPSLRRRFSYEPANLLVSMFCTDCTSSLADLLFPPTDANFLCEFFLCVRPKNSQSNTKQRKKYVERFFRSKRKQFAQRVSHRFPFLHYEFSSCSSI